MNIFIKVIIMNILDLPDIITFKIFYFLDIINLVKISEVCKKFNRYAKDFNIKDQQETIDYIFGFNYRTSLYIKSILFKRS